MFKETKCPICNALMIAVSVRWGDDITYMCPVHSFTEPKVQMYAGFDIDPKLVFKSLKD